MATNTTSTHVPGDARAGEDESTDAPAVGIDHVTVVPTNFDADE